MIRGFLDKDGLIMTEGWITIKSQIHLIYLNETGYVFSVNDYMKLRTEFRIIGKFIGTPWSTGYSSYSNSTPVELTKFETQLLLEKGITILLKKNILMVAPVAIKTEEFLHLFQLRVNQQEDSFINSKFEQSKLNIGRILLGKKKKLQISSRSEKNIKISEDKILNDIRCRIKFKNHNALSDISCEHLYKHDAELLNEYPPDNSLKYSIFKDIWEKGYYITSGVAFGAEFIVYPGDPLIYHASYIIIVEHNDLVNIYNLIAKCRLSVTVNKIFIYAYQNYAGNILYQAIHWKGQRGN